MEFQGRLTPVNKLIRMNFFSKNLRYLRKASELKQDDIASLVSKQDSTISNWEKGKCIPNVEELILLSKYFNIRLDLLITTDIEKAGIFTQNYFAEFQKDNPEQTSTEYDTYNFPDQQANVPDESLLTQVLHELKKLNGNVGKLRTEVKKKMD